MTMEYDLKSADPEPRGAGAAAVQQSRPRPTHRRMASATLALALLAPTLAFAGPDEDEIESGRQLAERMCATCHLNPGQGEKSAASSVPGFTAVANRTGQTFDGIVGWLRSVPPMMPNHRLSGGEMDALASYILSLRIAASPAMENTSPQR